MKQKFRIVVMEQNDLILRLIERWLIEAGHTVVIATLQTLSQVACDEAAPHLVIIDVPTPRSAGKIIKSVRQTVSSPILLLSARLERGTRSSISLPHQLGVRNLLPKPFTRDELLAAVVESIGDA